MSTNAAGDTVQIDASGKLTLADTSSINGGKVNNIGTLTLNGSGVVLKNGILANTGQVNAEGTATLDGETVTNSGAGFIDITGALTLDHNTGVTNGTGSGGSNAETVESGASLTLLDTSNINGGKLNNIGTLTLNGSGVVLKNGTLANTGQVNAEGTATLDGETVTNSGAGFIDITGALTLDHNTGVTNGTGSGGSNAETVESGASLTLLDTSNINGGKVNNIGTLTLNGSGVVLKNGILANTGQVNAEGTATLDGETVTNSGAGFIDITGALTLDHNTGVTNGTGSGGSNAETVESGASLTLLDTSNINGGKLNNIGTLTSERQRRGAEERHPGQYRTGQCRGHR